MKLGLISKSLLLGFALLLSTLSYNYVYVWNTSNNNGHITYVLRYYGLPFQYIFQELSSPVGPSSYFKVSAGYFTVDLLFWSAVAALVIIAVSRYIAKGSSLTQQAAGV
ncbi:MAG: hypothetical protein QXV32_07560 [Conexivisphaerales archaeon]